MSPFLEPNWSRAFRFLPESAVVELIIMTWVPSHGDMSWPVAAEGVLCFTFKSDPCAHWRSKRTIVEVTLDPTPSPSHK
ncbi:hypothetical protein CEXT_569571 [Caerostris extrusa]|uniref:Uncharacterized protein n=1 Tax=Caerostris extrusa TaxID=172846 RepID=A0AAV4RH56_CAEEX|nr:hypothetical protein CEXT_569571 [Caerostris extrusa]